MTFCHVIFVVIQLAALSEAVISELYHVVPEDSIDHCRYFRSGTCFTLASLESQVDGHQYEYLTLSFFPGEHLLTWRMNFTGATNITLNREQYLPTVLPHIKCVDNTGFDFTNIGDLVLDSLVVSGCRRQHAYGGGAMFVNNVTNVFVRYCQFSDNEVMSELAGGGAIYFKDTSDLSIQSSSFVSNSASCAGCEGGALVISNRSRVLIDSSHFELNTAKNIGGAVALYNFYEGIGGCVIKNTTFSENSVQQCWRCGLGGAIYTAGGYLMITNCAFTNNIAYDVGGAIFLDGSYMISHNLPESTLYTVQCQYVHNQAVRGGAIYSNLYHINTTNCHYIKNIGEHLGGAIYLNGILISSIQNTYETNFAGIEGGAIYGEVARISLLKFDHFYGNIAKLGAAIYISQRPGIEVTSSQFIGNSARLRDKSVGGVIYLRRTTLLCTGKSPNQFKDNLGSIYAFNSRVYFNGTTEFSNNRGQLGGAITGIQSEITFRETAVTTISGNIANYGGGVYLSDSIVQVYGSQTFEYNNAYLGGGIYAYQSTIQFSTDTEKPNWLAHSTLIIGNAGQHGGGMYLSASVMKLSNSFVHLEYNEATLNGGGLFLEQTSRISIEKLEPEENNEYRVALQFHSNSAFQQGGAVYISDETNVGILCEGATSQDLVQRSLNSLQCLLQTLVFYDHTYDSPLCNYVNTFFVNNSASLSGSDIYGGLFDRCLVSPLSEFAQLNPNITLTGLEYLKTTTSFDWRNKMDNRSNIASDPVQLCFCLNDIINCNYIHPRVYVRKGQVFTLRVVAVDQTRNPLNATIISSFVSEGGIGRFKEGQRNQHAGDTCTDVKYNVYSTQNFAKIQLYADGPCDNLGISKQEVNITFQPCICEIGFQPSSSEIECICECDTRLQPYVTNCTYEHETIRIESNVWIEYINSSNESGFVIQNCPFDYCLHKPAIVNLNSPSGSDVQCAYNRTGNLCGECDVGKSLIFASSRCETCSNYYLFILLPFALAGIALVSLILLLNMTVATGTVHGLIFYANVVGANHSIFLPFGTPNFITVFVSWFNLDLGIETCFYDGMDSYGKLLLQVVFPIYVFLLIGAIIALCEYFRPLTYLLGKRNPVAAFCTLILLSYSKLLRTIISALQYTNLNYPDGSQEIVWWLDANTLYFSATHIPRFLTAIVILILGVVYTVLLFFGQWFHLCSNWKIMKWVLKPKYNSFIDAYHAPLCPKHRYWVGLLLFARIFHDLVSAFASDSVIILSTGLMVLFLLLLKLLNARVYKNWLLDSLETSFFMNLAVLTLSTYFLKDTRGDQLILSYTSISVSFVTFVGIVLYHFCTYILKVQWIELYHKLCERFRNFQDRRLRRMYAFAQVPEQEPILEEEPAAEDNEFQEPERAYTDNDNDTNTGRMPDAPAMFEPPIIRSCVPMDQLREPALDDLAPVKEEDYIQRFVPPVIREPTFSVVDISSDRRD